MSNQLDLFHPMARRNDPLSSHDAANEHERSGGAQCQRDQVLKLVCRFPRSTSKELSSYGRVERHMVARRLPELEREGRIARIDTRGELRWVLSLGRL